MVPNSPAADGTHLGGPWCTWRRVSLAVLDVSVAAVLPDDLIIATEWELRHRVELRDLSSQSLGDWWLESQESAVLEVASIVVPDEHNYLLNPTHADFRRIATEPRRCFTSIRACFARAGRETRYRRSARTAERRPAVTSPVAPLHGKYPTANFDYLVRTLRALLRGRQWWGMDDCVRKWRVAVKFSWPVSFLQRRELHVRAF
jgi:hypothetical protein